MTEFGRRKLVAKWILWRRWRIRAGNRRSGFSRQNSPGGRDRFAV